MVERVLIGLPVAEVARMVRLGVLVDLEVLVDTLAVLGVLKDILEVLEVLGGTLEVLEVLVGTLEVLEVRVGKQRVLAVETTFVDSEVWPVYSDSRIRVCW